MYSDNNAALRLSNNLPKLRKDRQITQSQLAMGLSVTRQTIISIEKGHYMPSLVLALAIAKFFDKSIEEVFFYE